MYKLVIGTAGAVALATMGCVDARDEFNNFNDRLIDASGTGIDAPIVSELPDVNGTFLVKARPNLGSTDFFFYFIATVTFTPVTENTGHFHWVVQPLDFETFVPVGDTLTPQDGDVDSTATVTVGLAGLLPGRANSVSQSDVTLNGSVQALLQSEDFFCGPISGTAGSVSLNGSSFAATRFTGELGTELPVSALHACP